MLGQLKLFDLGLGVDNETICYAGALLNELLDTLHFGNLFLCCYMTYPEKLQLSVHILTLKLQFEIYQKSFVGPVICVFKGHPHRKQLVVGPKVSFPQLRDELILAVVNRHVSGLKIH